MFNLGVMHEWGDGARKDPDLARRYYHLASEISPSAYYPTYLAEMRMDFVEWLQKVRSADYCSFHRLEDPFPGPVKTLC